MRLAATNNISSAGRELGLSPAVASSYIKKLEKGLGVRLVHRTTRKVLLTREGQVLLPYAQDVISSVAAACASVGSGKKSPRGTLRITASASFGRMHLIPVSKGFLSRYTDLTLNFQFTDVMVDLVEGGFDITIRNTELKGSPASWHLTIALSVHRLVTWKNMESPVRLKHCLIIKVLV